MDVRDLAVSAALAALSLSVALGLGLAFEGTRWILPLVAIALVPHVVAAAGRAMNLGSPYPAIVASAILLVAGLLVVAGPSPSDLIDRLIDGADSLRGARRLPLPATDGRIAAAMVVVWAAATVADYVCLDRNGSVGALVPGIAVLVLLAIKDVPDVWLPISLFGVFTVVLLAVQHRRLLDRQRTWIGDRPRARDTLGALLVGVLVGLVAVGMSVGGAVALLSSDRPLIDVEWFNPFPEGGNPSSYRTDRAPLLNVGDELRQPEIAVMFRVRADEPQYWRTVALDKYSSLAGGQWSLDASGDAVSDSLDEAVPDDALFQEYDVTPAMPERWVPAAFRAVEVEGANLGLVVPSSSTLVTDDDTIGGARYRVRSAIPPSAEQINRAAAAAPVPDDVARYTELPADIPPVITETAQAIAGDLPDPVAKAEALRDFFRDGSFVYDPDVDLGDDEAAIEIFMNERRGFCVQFATAYALMARSLGIPARIGIGYTAGTLDEGSGTYVVTNQDAHAWPELYFTGTGWSMPYDPTPVGDGTLPGGSDLPGEVAPETTPTTTAQTAPPPSTVPQSAPPATGVPSGSTPTDTPTGGDDGSVQIDTQEVATDDEPLLPAFVLLLLVGLLLLAPFATLLFVKHRRRWQRRHATDPAAAIAGAWSEALDTLTDHRHPPSDTDTPMETAARASTVTETAAWAPMSSLAQAYGEVTYAERVPSADRVEEAWHDVEELRAALDHPLGPIERTRVRLSFRSLRRDRGRAVGPRHRRVSETL